MGWLVLGYLVRISGVYNFIEIIVVVVFIDCFLGVRY